MRKKKVKAEKHNTKAAILFVLFVFTIILISAVFKVISVVRQSKFDGTNRFTITVYSDKNLEIVSFFPTNHSISILRIEEGNKDLKVGKFLKIPVDGFIKAKSNLAEASFWEENKDIASLMSNIFFNYNNIKTNLTIIDILRLVLASKTTPLNNIISHSISSSLESQKVDKIVQKIFKDEEVDKENLTIEIINATYETGLGSRLSRLVTNMGGNVVVVSTESNSQKNSIILYNGKKSYTVEKLSKVLGFRTSEMNKQSIADVTIVIGEDNKDPSPF